MQPSSITLPSRHLLDSCWYKAQLSLELDEKAHKKPPSHTTCFHPNTTQTKKPPISQNLISKAPLDFAAQKESIINLTPDTSQFPLVCLSRLTFQSHLQLNFRGLLVEDQETRHHLEIFMSRQQGRFCWFYSCLKQRWF